MRHWKYLHLYTAIVAMGLLAGGCLTTPSTEPTGPVGLEETALDRYVKAPDPNYKYSVVNTIDGEGFTAYIVDMTSQSWRSPDEVDRTLWQHWVTIIRPDSVTSPIGFVYITGGDNGGAAPTKADEGFAKLAVATGTVVTELRQIPNQPITFAGEPRGREEDELIAYTWDKYMRTGDELWPARLPMTKAVVRAMDTVTDLCAKPEGGGVTVNKFFVAGGSKRGWTTWTTAAVDERVVAICPIVIDLLNLQESFTHHWEVYGFWAPAVGDYVAMGIMDWMGTPEYDALLKIVEPYSYRGRYTMPKFIMNATQDEFFIPDSSQFYFDDLPAEKYLRYVPNAGHGMRGSDARESLFAYYASVVQNTPRPQFEWRTLDGGTIYVKTIDTPTAIKLWQATNPKTRDFRQDTIGQAWTSTDVKFQEDGTYWLKVGKPASGWTAYFVELTYPGPINLPMKFTTGVSVTPEKAPFEYTPPKTSPKDK